MDPTGQKTGGASAGDGGTIISSGDMSGGVTVSPEPITSSPGDEIIASSPSGPQLLANRKLILGVVLAVLVLVGAAIIFVVTNQRTSEDAVVVDTSEVTASNLHKHFNLYANYLIDGSDSTAEINAKDIEYSDSLKILQMAKTVNSESRTYFDNLEKLFSDFIDDYEERYPNADSPFAYDHGFVLLMKSHFDTYRGDDALLSVFLENDGDAALALSAMSSEHDAIRQNEMLEQYSDVVLELYQLKFERFSAYQDASCITNEKINRACANSRANFDGGKNARITELENGIDELIQKDCIVFIVNNCQNVKAMLEGENL